MTTHQKRLTNHARCPDNRIGLEIGESTVSSEETQPDQKRIGEIKQIGLPMMETNTDMDVRSLPAPDEDKSKGSRIGIIIGAIVIVLVIAAALFFLITASPETTAEIRDIFIIFMALVLLLVMVAAVILVIQLAILINLLQNEIKPMLSSLNETVNTVKGTTAFLSNNMVEPVIKMNEYMAGLRGLFDFFRFTRR